jgi:hypothetical protein
MWKDRQKHLMIPKVPLLRKGMKVATIGSCFAEELAAGLTRFGFDGGMHPTGLFYNTKSIRQEVERIFGGWSARNKEPLWKTQAGYVNPFKSLNDVFTSEAELKKHNDNLDAQADTLFRGADLVVMTIGLIEAWRNPKTGNVYRQIPHPDVFEHIDKEFYRLSTQEMLEDLHAIAEILRKAHAPKLLVTVSPIPLHATITAHDVRVANSESKARIRAAVSEFVESHDDVFYFPSYEIVTTAERMSDFMKVDGRHVHRHGVDYILSYFLQSFVEDADVPEIDDSWLAAPEKTAARPDDERLGLRKVSKMMLREIKAKAKELL